MVRADVRAAWRPGSGVQCAHCNAGSAPLASTSPGCGALTAAIRSSPLDCRKGIELIASENFTSQPVMEVGGQI